MKHMRWLRMSLMAFAAVGLFGGCNSDDGGSSDGGGSGSSSVVGTWGVADGTTATPETASTWWVFYSDGRFTYFNNPELTSVHLTGTYTADGSTFVGSFVNPGVGDGNIEGTVAGDGKTFQMDFIEHWHDPSKHVPLAGVRL